MQNRRVFLEQFAAIPFASSLDFAAVNTHSMKAPKNEYVIEAGYALLEKGNDLQIDSNVSILIKKDRIEKIVSGAIKGNFKRINAKGDFVLPGFISGHSHAMSGPVVKGLLDTGRSYRPPEKLMEECSNVDLEAIASLAIAELLTSGCTTILDQSLSLKQMKAIVNVAEKWNVRLFPGAMTPSMNRVFELWELKSDKALFDSVPATLKEIEDNLAYSLSVMNKGDGRIQPMTSPHGTDTNTPETLNAMKRAADRLGTGFHMHLAQSNAEKELTLRLWKKEPLQWLAEIGFLEAPFFAAHMSAMNWETDPEILKKYGAVITLCPLIGSPGKGIQPLTETKAAGIALNIGIDSPINNYLETLRMAVILERVKLNKFKNDKMKGQAFTMLQAIDCATRIPARGLRRDDLGRLKEGAKADIIGINLSGSPVGPGILPPEPLSSMLYTNSSSVKLTITDGIVQMMEGVFLMDDLQKISQKAGVAVEKIWAKLRATGYFD